MATQVKTNHRDLLRRMGFTHVGKGFLVLNPQTKAFENVTPGPDELGCWGISGEKSVAITEDGEVWLGNQIRIDETMIQTVCPRGKRQMAPLP